MKLGYARVSTQDQDLKAQREALLASGCERIFEEKASGSIISMIFLLEWSDHGEAGEEW